MSHQKFKDCIDACSECAVECSHCESECLNEQDVKMLARCIKLDHDCAAICLFAMQAMAREVSLRKKSANYAPKFVQLAPKNVKNMHTWSIAKIVRNPVENVLLSAVI